MILWRPVYQRASLMAFLVCLGAAVREEHAVQIAGRDLERPAELAPSVCRCAMGGPIVQSLSACSLIAATIFGCW